MRKFAAIMLMLTILMAPSAFAASPWATGSYADQVKGKLSFGFKNMVLGWTQMFSVPQDYRTEGKNVFKGIGTGIINALLYTTGGALDFVTFPIPQLDIPLPGNGIQI